MEPLTGRQKEILEFITGFYDDSGCTPTVREIAGHFRISIGPVQKHVRELVRKGYVRHRPGVSRGLDPVSRRSLVPVPVLGSVPAGRPLEAIEQAAEAVYVERETLRGGEHFALRVTGDSMTGAGILEGDAVVVRRQPVAEDGEIVVAVIDGEATVKRLRKKEGDVWLEPANPRYGPIRDPGMAVLGKVVYLTRDYDRASL